MDLLWAEGFIFDQNFLLRSGRRAFSSPSMETIAVATAAVALLLAGGLWGFQQRRRTPAALATTVVLLLFFLMLEASSFVWQAIRPLQRVQFPWRLMTQVDLATAFLFAFSLNSVNQHSNGWKLAAAGLLVCAPLISLNLPLVWDGHYGPMHFRNVTANELGGCLGGRLQYAGVSHAMVRATQQRHSATCTRSLGNGCSSATMKRTGYRI